MLYEAKPLRIYDPEANKTYTRATSSDVTTPPIKNGVPQDLPKEFYPVNSKQTTASTASDSSPSAASDKNDKKQKLVYFIHYKGWKSTWDEWVSDERVLAWNEENLRTQKELRQMALAASNKKKFIHLDVDGPILSDLSVEPSSGSNGGNGHADSGASGQSQDHSNSGTSGASGKRRESSIKDDFGSNTRATKRSKAYDNDTDREDDFIRKQEVSLSVPDQLKALLVDDWEFVTKEHQVVPLPREVTVADILEAYAKVAGASRPVGTAEYEIFTEVISGIKHYFDRALGNILLYRFERQQYLNIRKKFPGVPMSEIYGPEHLLRLFVSLPALIAQTNMDQQSVAALREHLEECLRFMLKYRSKFFLKEYENTSPHYEAMSRGT